MIRHAVFDDARRYRYRLSREWSDAGRTVVFVMLNPSLADAERDDPTIRRCIGFARSWGYSRLDVVNLFALIAPSPRRLRRTRDPVGLENDRHLVEATRAADLVVAAWGNLGRLFGRSDAVAALLAPSILYCLGCTSSGQPRHPLYAPKDLRPAPMRSGAASQLAVICCGASTAAAEA